MKKAKIDKIIAQIALENGISVIEIRDEIRMAIHFAYENRDELSAEFWGQWSYKPSLDEFIMAANKAIIDKILADKSK